ncbi:hypothetical protein MPNT_60098 [Candidatus Methylacidithermus pantelleriae]|uniref:Uncharacterized protein n=1 Tax=Candidatus Methylacidithermus pantelleriae TaxID=2744239 RepID=A0A8J2BVE3_9BACT|nr:hypothetical protein MPNT_60098 [Candidatus Methylacidithermus pantelleriae]
MALHPGADLVDGLNDPQRFVGEANSGEPKPIVSRNPLLDRRSTPAREERHDRVLPPPQAPLRSRSVTFLSGKRQTSLLPDPPSRLVTNILPLGPRSELQLEMLA